MPLAMFACICLLFLHYFLSSFAFVFFFYFFCICFLYEFVDFFCMCFKRERAAVVENIFELIHTAGKAEQGGGGEEEENPALRLHPQVTSTTCFFLFLAHPRVTNCFFLFLERLQVTFSCCPNSIGQMCLSKYFKAISEHILIEGSTFDEQSNIFCWTKFHIYMFPKGSLVYFSSWPYDQVDCLPVQCKAAERHDQEAPQGDQGRTGEAAKQSGCKLMRRIGSYWMTTFNKDSTRINKTKLNFSLEELLARRNANPKRRSFPQCRPLLRRSLP